MMSTNAKPYKETLNLPVTRFDMKANLTVREPQIQARWREQDLYAQVRQARAGPAAQGPARRSALRQRRDPHGHPAQQGAQGHRRPIADDGRLRQPVRARLGLPRPADRAQGRQGPRLEGRRR